MAEKPGNKQRIILLCTDGALHSKFAFKYYCRNVHREGDFLVMLFCPHMDLQTGGNRARDAERLEDQLKKEKIDGKVVVVNTAMAPKESIIEFSVQENANLIILGARRLGQGLQQQGTTKQYVVRKSQVPVLICKHGEYEATTSIRREGVRRLVVGGSDCGMHASEGLESITTSSGPPLQKELQTLYADNASLLMEFIKDDLQMPGEVFIGKPDSNPGDVILEVAQMEGADLIVVGARGLGQRAFEAGSRTSDKVANNSEVTVFVNKF